MNLPELTAPLRGVDGAPPQAWLGAPEAVAPSGFISGLPPGTRLAHAPGHLAARARLAMRVRVTAARARLEVTNLVWPAGKGNRLGMTAAVRSAVLGGSLHIALPRGAVSVVDTVAARLGAKPPRRIDIGSGGGMRLVLVRSEGPALLRIGHTGSPADPSQHYAGLTEVRHLDAVPTPLAIGQERDTTWSLEELVRGRPPVRMTRRVMESARSFLASLPAARTPSLPMRLGESISGVAGDAKPALGELLAFMAEGLDGFPGTLVHGDFWLGNMLFTNHGLAAVTDWDGWDAEGAPGTDLIHLHADDQRRRQRSNYGAVAGGRVWRTATLRSELSTHLGARGLDADDATLDVLGVAWWVTAVGTALRRNALQARDEWIERNVRRPACSLARRLG